MSWSLSLLLLTPMPSIAETANLAVTRFDNYTDAYHSAQKLERPLLVVLNPAVDSGQRHVTLNAIEATEQRRTLLQKYVVAVIDTSTPHGRIMHGLFDSAPLPRVVVIDREQKRQVFQSSDTLQDEQWTQILETFENADCETTLDLTTTRRSPTTIWCYT